MSRDRDRNDAKITGLLRAFSSLQQERARLETRVVQLRATIAHKSKRNSALYIIKSR